LRFNLRVRLAVARFRKYGIERSVSAICNKGETLEIGMGNNAKPHFTAGADTPYQS
jgi:hypothetical protein